MGILTGVAGAVQVAVMARLGERVGILGALAFASLLQALLAAAILVAVRQSVGSYGAVLRQPAWLWLGGVMGLFIILTVTFAGSQIGTAATVGILVAGQLAMGAAIDRFGWLGSEKIALHWPRVVGIVLLFVGAALSLRK
jgi:transporter family-2 protein